MKKRTAPDRGANHGRMGVGAHNRGKKKKESTLKMQIRSIERLMKRDLLSKEARSAQERHLKDLRQQYDARVDKKFAGRYKQVKFIERRKIERSIRRLEKEAKNADDEETRQQAAAKLAQFKEDLDYVRFYPKTQKYISLFRESNDAGAALRRQKVREQIKSKLAAAAAAGVELEETTEPEEDFVPDAIQDDFFMEASDMEDETISIKVGTQSGMKTPPTPQSTGHDVEPADGASGKRKRSRKRPKKHK